MGWDLGWVYMLLVKTTSTVLAFISHINGTDSLRAEAEAAAAIAAGLAPPADRGGLATVVLLHVTDIAEANSYQQVTVPAGRGLDHLPISSSMEQPK